MDLREAHERLVVLALHPISRKQLKQATNDWLSRVVNAWSLALQDSTPDHLHELRKQVKTSHYHARLLQAALVREVPRAAGSAQQHVRQLARSVHAGEAGGGAWW